jgi:hypothetical protein
VSGSSNLTDVRWELAREQCRSLVSVRLPLVGLVPEVLAHQLRGTLSRAAPQSLRLRAIDIRVQPRDVADDVDVALDLQWEGSGRPHAFYVDLTRSAVRPVSACWSGGQNVPLKSAAKLVRVVTSGAHAGSSGQLLFRGTWHRPVPGKYGSQGAGLIYPEELPTVLTTPEQSESKRAVLTLIREEGPNHLRVFGIRSASGPPRCQTPSFLQLVVVPSHVASDTLATFATGSVTFTEALLSRLRTGGGSLTPEFVGSTLKFLSTFFGTDLPGDILVTDRASVVASQSAPIGTLLTVSQPDLEAWRSDWTFAAYNLAFRLASCWCEVGFEVVGRGGMELAAGIRSAAGYLWATEIEGTVRTRRILDRLSALARYSRLGALLETARGAVDPRASAAQSLELVGTLGRAGTPIDALRYAARTYWGRRISATHLWQLVSGERSVEP